jgi:hypothetical protein
MISMAGATAATAAIASAAETLPERGAFIRKAISGSARGG